ncbi:hypothetical protein L1887_48873 [Cichorium endivia]|nr:hypothetical protein L1887_48873 [Cichorium endivia]
MTPPTLTQHTARPRASSQSTHAWSRRSTPKLSSRKPASSSTAQRSALLSLRRCDSHPQPLLPHARLVGTCPSSPSVWDRKRSRPLHAQTSPFDPSCPLCETEQNTVPLNCGRSGYPLHLRSDGVLELKIRHIRDLAISSAISGNVDWQTDSDRWTRHHHVILAAGFLPHVGKKSEEASQALLRHPATASTITTLPPEPDTAHHTSLSALRLSNTLQSYRRTTEHRRHSRILTSITTDLGASGPPPPRCARRKFSATRPSCHACRGRRATCTT